jgi:sugar/nucleoside kinase (ribokinase family)
MILVFGTVCLDRILEIPALPRPGGYVEVEAEEILLGGEASNTANALREWGIDVFLAGNGAGDGPEAERLRALVRERGLLRHKLETSPGATPVCDILLTPDGERTMIGRGFSTMPRPWEPNTLLLEPGAWVTADPNLGAFAREVVRSAQSVGCRTYLLDFFRPDDPVAQGSYWQSSTDWVGERGREAANLAWAADWSDRHGCTTLLTDGPRGFALARPGQPSLWLPPFPSPPVVDTTGAGDIFRAGVLQGLEKGLPLAETLAFAAAAGCLKCAYRGATRRVPQRDEIAAHLAAHGTILAVYRDLLA